MRITTQMRANQRGAGKGGVAVLWRAGRAQPALPDRERYLQKLTPVPGVSGDLNPGLTPRFLVLIFPCRPHISIRIC